jgi:hypothetical protein
VISTNDYGSSEYSDVGNGATIWVEPDPPQFLANNAAVTSAISIGLSWSEGVSNGGTEVIDYRIWYTSESNANFVELDSGVLNEFYETSITLIPGQNYKFKV